MLNQEHHHQLILERLTLLREQAALERQLPRFSFRRRVARFLHGLACTLERVDARVELQRAQI